MQVNPVERAENLEYRNRLSGVCWGAFYFSIESIFESPCIFSVKKLFITICTLLGAENKLTYIEHLISFPLSLIMLCY